ncbi:MAG TPA: branched-chain amino acid ABC transporter permease [Candidatus Thermoplasmatota archaeon]|nr:branched-chain amino acid ABC transporter permease [Candidatus Thermoplasmatota archaeon]
MNRLRTLQARGASLDLAVLAQEVANGVAFGSILALCAIGLTLVYGILNLSNFAHGDTLTLGAYVAPLFGTTLFLPASALVPTGLVAGAALLAAALADRTWTRRLERGERIALAGFGGLLVAAAAVLAVLGPGGAGSTTRVLAVATLLAVLAVVAFSLLAEVLVWRPLRRRGATVMSLVIASLGLAILLRNAIQQGFGGDYRSLMRATDVAPSYFGVRLSNEQVLAIATTVVLVGLVHLFLTRSRSGKAMRALADNRDLARACGVDVDRVVMHVWAIGGALVAVAGVLLALVQNNNVNVSMGFNILIPIFAAVVLGGVGSAYGAMAGGLVVGIAMRLGPAEYDLAWAFLVLIAVLLVRPQGILGRKA